PMITTMWSRQIGPGATLLWGVATLACAADQSQTPSVVFRDSMGIELVESHRPAWREGEGWRVSAEPDLVISDSRGGPEYLFHQIGSAARLSDGRIAVANSGSGEVRFYDSAGSFLYSFGQRGGGPGEFRHLSSVHRLRGDALLAFDPGARRITLIDSAGRMVRSVQLDRVGPERISSVAPLGDTTLLAITSRSSGAVTFAGTGSRRESAPILSYSRAGHLLDTVAVVPGMELYHMGNGRLGLPLFNHHTVAAAMAGDVVIGTGESFEVGVYSPEGELRRLIRLPDADLSLAEEDVRLERERRLALAGEDEAARTLLEELEAGLPNPTKRPAYAALQVDPHAHLWLAEYRTSPMFGEPRVWRVFDQSGRWLGEVEVPEGLRILEIGDDYILARAKDANEVERIELYRLMR
ncbi:MAG TPA: hypothetical protein VMN39_06100, partial [Longimicrobiaceae bacterium]|nr:hypothetical protein [Longimicrobiaceae bacterium]